MQENIFDMLGIVNPAKEEEKKKEAEKKAKAEEKKKKTAAKKSVNSNVSTIKIEKDGFSVITGYYPEIMIEPSELEEGKETLTVTELLKVLEKKHVSSFIDGHVKLAEIKADKGKKYLLTSDGLSMSFPKKGLSGEYQIILGGFETAISGESISMDDVKEMWTTHYPEHKGIVDFQYDEDRHIIVPVFKQKKVTSGKATGTVSIWGQEPHSFTDEKVEEVVKKLYSPLFMENYHIVASPEEGQYFVVPYIKTGAATPKTQMYPTEGVTLSLVFKRIELSPEMFGGKSEVTEDEILKLVAKDFPEYGNGRAAVTYLKKEKLIMVSIKSSKKGALSACMDNISAFGTAVFTCVTEEDMQTKLAEAKTIVNNSPEEYTLAYVELGNDRLRVEKTPVGLFVAGDGIFKSYAEFHMALPKIPKDIMDEIYSFFLQVKQFQSRSNEAAVQIFWDLKKQEYFVYYPVQEVSTVNVDFERNLLLENAFVLVADVHSHGSIRPFFSSTDNADEKGTRLFCVFGNMDDTTQYQYSLRAGTGGNFIDVDEETVLEDMFNGMFTSDAVVYPSDIVLRGIYEKISEKVRFQ